MMGIMIEKVSIAAIQNIDCMDLIQGKLIPLEKKDRHDTYRPVRTYNDPSTMNKNIVYELEHAECNPDVDW